MTEQVEPKPRYVLHMASEALEPQPPIEWIIHEVFTAGSVNLVVGEGGTKKTYSLLDAGLCVATGTPWLDKPVTQGAVLIIDEESGHRRMLRRVGACMRGHDIEDMAFSWVTLAQFNLTTQADIDEIDKLMEYTGARLVIIDALADVALGADENSVKDMQPLFLKLRGLAEKHNAAIVLIHHSNKAGGYRGSTAIKGAIDTLFMVDSKPRSPSIEFTAAKSRDIEEYTMAAFAQFGKDEQGNETFRLYAAIPLEKQEHYSKSEFYVLDYIKRTGNSSMSDIKANADRCTPNAARQAVYSLVQRGKLARINTGGTGDAAIYGLVENA